MPRTLLMACLLYSLVGQAQSRRVDTTFYDSGSVETVSWYTNRPFDALSRAELFQRGLSEGSPMDSVEIRDSMHMYDPQGNRAPSTPRLDRQAARFVRQRRERKARHQALIREGRLSPFVVENPIRLESRVGEVLTDTLLIHYASEDAFTFGVGTRGGILIAPDSLSFSRQSSLKLPVVMLARPGSRSARVLLTSPEGDVVLTQHYSVWGYDLHADDFADSAEAAKEIDWQAGRDLQLRVPGNQKLLTVRHADHEDCVTPIGQELEAIPTKDWSLGDYTLVLTDLGTGEERYCRLRVFKD